MNYHTLNIWTGDHAGEYNYMSRADAQAHADSLGLTHDEYEIYSPSED